MCPWIVLLLILEGEHAKLINKEVNNMLTLSSQVYNKPIKPFSQFSKRKTAWKIWSKAMAKKKKKSQKIEQKARSHFFKNKNKTEIRC